MSVLLTHRQVQLCDGCGRRITETEQWAAYRRTGDQERPWEKYQEAAIDVIAQIETRRKA